MKHQLVRQGQTTTPGTTCPTLFDKCVGSLKSPAYHVTLKMQETGPTVYNPYLGSDPLARLFFMFLRRRKMYLILKQEMSRSFN